MGQYTAASAAMQYRLRGGATYSVRAEVGAAEGFAGDVASWPGGTAAGEEGAAREADARRRTKPRFLAEVERYIAREIARLGGSRAPAAARLQVHREAFQFLVENFQTYRPLLASIRRAYEAALEEADRRAGALPELEARLQTAEEQAEGTLRRERAELRAREEEWERRLEKLEKTAKHARWREQADAKKLRETETLLARAQERADDAAATNRTLFSSLRRYERVQAVRDHHQYEEAINMSELTEKLAELQANYDQALSEMHDLRAQMVTMVAGDTHRQALDDAEALSHQMLLLRDEQDRLEKENRRLTAALQRKKGRRASVAVAAEAATAKGGGAAGGVAAAAAAAAAGDDEEEEEDGDDSERLRARVAELEDRLRDLGALSGDEDGAGEDGADRRREAAAAADAAEAGRFIACRGSDPSVPKFLRYRGKVRNRRMTKREAESMVREVWDAKYARPETAEQALPDFLYQFFKKKFGIQSMIAETGYNLVDALERYRYDADCDLFLNVLQGKVSEAVYSDQMRMLDGLRERLARLDVQSHGGRRKNTVGRKSMLAMLQAMFRAKDENRWKRLKKALYLDQPRNEIRYIELFAEDREGNQGRFLECVRDQHLDEIAEFAREIEDACQEVAARAGGMLSMGAIFSMLERLDPAKPRAEIEEYVCRGFGVTLFGALREDYICSVKDFLSKLIKTGLVKRTGPRPDDDDGDGGELESL